MSEIEHRVRTLLLTAALVLLGTVPLDAQVDTGTVLGIVTDASGAPISGADVKLTNADTNAIITTITASDGYYKFAPVRIGRYKLLASFQGFQIVLLRGVIVNVGAAVVVDFHLKPGSIKETIEIKADASQLQTQDASVGQRMAFGIVAWPFDRDRRFHGDLHYKYKNAKPGLTRRRRELGILNGQISQLRP
jgi:Carboxypeptidase regulatory-like domain